MEIFRVLGVGIIGVILANLMQSVKREFSLYIVLATGMLILVFVLDKTSEAVETFYTLADKTGVSDRLFAYLVKIVGIGYLTEYAAAVCVDAGASSIATKIQLYGKIVIFLIAAPLVTGLTETLIGFVSET